MHPVSQRVAIIEEDNGMVWLYLSHPEVTRPARDCPAFITAPPPPTVDWERVLRGETPRIAADVATDCSFIQSPAAEDFGTIWTPDGESVALRHNGEIICMIVAGHQRGHSRAVNGVGPLGFPFDEPLAIATCAPENPSLTKGDQSLDRMTKSATIQFCRAGRPSRALRHRSAHRSALLT